MTKNKAITKVVGCGGCGVNIVKNVGDMLASLGDGFCDIERYYIDSSKNDTPQEVIDCDTSYFIKPSSLSKGMISGSGGERATNAKDIEEGVKEFIDNNNLAKYNVNEYTILVASISGGTGSMVIPYILKNLLENDIPTVVVAVGDSTNGLYAKNTLKSISTLHNLATKYKKALSVMYVNNGTFMQDGIKNAIENANRSIFNSLSSLLLFLSGENKSIDHKDMAMIIDQSKYTSINIPSGIYALNAFSKTVVLGEGMQATVARTLTIDPVSPDINLSLGHHKTGTILSENAKSIYKEHVPIHLVAYTNFFTSEVDRLKDYVNNIDNAFQAITIDSLTSTNDAVVDDDGIVF